MSEAWSSTDSGAESPFGLPRSRPELEDAELCAQIRRHRPDSVAGRAAFGELYARHRAPALYFALRLNRDRSRAEDAVSEAFAKIWRAWANGNGPDTAFKPYLMAAVRSESFRRSATNRATAVVEPDVLTFLAGHEPSNHADEVAERDQLARAFKALPAGWQNAITMIDIDGTATSSAAEAMNLSSNSFSSLLRRAREGLRVSYLQQHVEPARPECSDYSSELARYVRGQLSGKRTAVIDEHLRDCGSCRLQTFRLRSINSNFQAWITPAAIAAALIEFGHDESGAAFLLHGDSSPAGESLSATGRPPAQAATGGNSLSASAGSTSGGASGTAAVSGSAVGLKAAIVGLAAAATIAVGAIAAVNLQSEPGPPPASAQEQSTMPATTPLSADPEDSESPDSAPRDPGQSPSDSAGAQRSQETVKPAPSQAAAPADDVSAPTPAEEDPTAPASPEAVERSEPGSEDTDDRVEETEDPTPADPEPSRPPTTSPEPEPEPETGPEASAGAADESDIDSDAAADESGEVEVPAEENEDSEQDADPGESDSSSEDSSSTEEADSDSADASTDDEGQTGDADDADGEGSHSEDDDATNDDDGRHCHDFGRWQYCH